MKELSIEEKAKRYDEAIAVINKSETDKYGCIIGIKPSDIFSELKESEDEKIRKELIDFVKSRLAGFPQCEKFIAWVEKQEQWDSVGPVSEEDKLHLMPDEQSSNKVEPKFKVGDWVVYCNEDVDLITGIEEKGYCINNGGYIPFVCASDIRLWTIQDAKDGDVLCSEQIIVLFKKWEDNTDYTFVIAYAGIDVSGKLQITNGHWLISNNSKSATKEQRDLLFQKMKEAGYEWDAENKELKKFNNALKECEIEHIEHGKYYYCIKDYYSGGCKRASKGEVVQVLRGMSMMALGVKANEYFIPVKRIVDVSHAWSEEDESILQGILDEISANKHDAKEYEWKTYDRFLDWLKSLKERYAWKPSDEQMKALHDMNITGNISYAEQGKTLIVLYNDLKKLREV